MFLYGNPKNQLQFIFFNHNFIIIKDSSLTTDLTLNLPRCGLIFRITVTPWAFNTSIRHLIIIANIIIKNMITQPQKLQPSQSSLSDTHAIKQQRLRRCEEIVKCAETRIQVEIQNGSTLIHERSIHIQAHNQQHHAIVNENPQRSLRDKIGSLNNDLELLQKHIMAQKEHQRIKQQAKRKQANELIERLKKQKQEHRHRIKIGEMNTRLKNSVFSEDILKIMRERRDQLIIDKKKDMQDRIIRNVNRRVERQDGQVKNQVHYWSKVKQFQQRKRHHSTKILPSINKIHEQQQQFGVNLAPIQRKNSLKDQLYHKRSMSKQDLASNYQQVVNRFLERAKAKQVQSRSQHTPNINGKSRIVTHEAISDKSELVVENSRVVPMQNDKINKIMASYRENKHKLLGDQYLKESLLRVSRSKSPKVNTLEDSKLEESIEMRGNPAIFSRNDKLANLEQRRDRILQNLMSQKLDKPRAIEMLAPIQSKLDRINPEGIEQRLKHKLQIFQQIQNRQVYFHEQEHDASQDKNHQQTESQKKINNE